MCIRDRINDLYSVFMKKKYIFSPHMLISVLFEFSNSHKIVNKQVFRKEFEEIFLKISLVGVTTRDVFDYAYILKRFMVINDAHASKWIEIAKEMQKRIGKKRDSVQLDRVGKIVANLEDFLGKKKDHFGHSKSFQLYQNAIGILKTTTLDSPKQQNYCIVQIFQNLCIEKSVLRWDITWL
eukprot:TRINITY_DN10739_c0_g1_i2.p1 TRINITY_DN10739_c0_g1~~TRINITY_DN10739_c0_g1_i2.p1  ORF type:complete len:201 (+),score=56.57 TRINITY_DN10739_c0_g1_i2:62-604(+)